MPKNKYPIEMKLEIVNQVIKENQTVPYLSQKYQIHKDSIYKWVEQYRRFGLDGLERKPRRYTAEFKYEVIQDMRENHLSLKATARKYNIGMITSIQQWERIYLTSGMDGLREERRGKASTASGTNKGRKPVFKKEEEEDLLAEVHRLRMENEYLKKLNTLVLSKTK